MGEPRPQAALQRPARGAAAHDLGLHPVGPDRVRPPQPVRLEAGDRAPVAEQPADREGEIVGARDQRANPPPNAAGSAGEKPVRALGLRQRHDLDALERRPDARQRHPVGGGGPSPSGVSTMSREKFSAQSRRPLQA